MLKSKKNINYITILIEESSIINKEKRLEKLSIPLNISDILEELPEKRLLLYRIIQSELSF